MKSSNRVFIFLIAGAGTFLVLMCLCLLVFLTPALFGGKTTRTPMTQKSTSVPLSSQTRAPEPAARATTAAPSGWKTYTDANGFSVEYPSGWQVQKGSSPGLVEIRGTGDERVLILPFFANSSLSPQSALAALQKQSVKLIPDLRSGTPQAVSSRAVRIIGPTGDNVSVAALTWTPTTLGRRRQEGSAGYIYALSSPRKTYPAMEQTFIQILKSAKAWGPSVRASSATTLRFEKWSDPRESAFTLDVPSGWKVNGGLFRFSALDVREAVAISSPDEKILVTLGDSSLPRQITPDSMSALGGLPEGTWYSPGYGEQFYVWRYRTGVEFAQEYVTSKFGSKCSNLTIERANERPDIANPINYSQTRITIGETVFTCLNGSQPLRGYYFAGTEMTSILDIHNWRVAHLYGFLAAPDQTALASAVLNRAVYSRQIDIAWYAQQMKITMEAAKIATQTQAEISTIITDSYWSRQDPEGELARRRSNAMLGVEDVVDPATDQPFQVESGSNYYWLDPRGMIVGTDTDTRPTLDFRPLIRLP
ncbi:MAG: hypothetical protein KGJ80_04535 [Chloroflexota bacterium]|nr:hypothetical protein [Chloroflexota bacterium]